MKRCKIKQHKYSPLYYQLLLRGLTPNYRSKGSVGNGFYLPNGDSSSGTDNIIYFIEFYVNDKMADIICEGDASVA
jgi:hypothetical protein